MSDKQDQFPDNPMHHPEEQPVGTEAPFKPGRLLLVLAVAVILISLVAVGAETYFS